MNHKLCESVLWVKSAVSQYHESASARSPSAASQCWESECATSQECAMSQECYESEFCESILRVRVLRIKSAMSQSTMRQCAVSATSQVLWVKRVESSELWVKRAMSQESYESRELLVKRAMSAVAVSHYYRVNSAESRELWVWVLWVSTMSCECRVLWVSTMSWSVKCCESVLHCSPVKMSPRILICLECGSTMAPKMFAKTKQKHVNMYIWKTFKVQMWHRSLWFSIAATILTHSY